MISVFTWGTEFLLCVCCPLDLLWEFFDDFRTSCCVVDIDGVVIPSGWSTFLYGRIGLSCRLTPSMWIQNVIQRLFLKSSSVKLFQLKAKAKYRINLLGTLPAMILVWTAGTWCWTWTSPVVSEVWGHHTKRNVSWSGCPPCYLDYYTHTYCSAPGWIICR